MDSVPTSRAEAITLKIIGVLPKDGRAPNPGDIVRAVHQALDETAPANHQRITLHLFETEQQMEIDPAMIGAITPLSPVADDSGKALHGERTRIDSLPDRLGTSQQWLVYERLSEIRAAIVGQNLKGDLTWTLYRTCKQTQVARQYRPRSG